MPNCFQLLDKNTGLAVTFTQVDEELCAFLGVEADPIEYHDFWYDTIGCMIALGRTQDQINEIMPHRKVVTDWIFENFNTNAWYERK